eukprot:scaffold50730_cov69-Phaeocystis_antarctica.AAC.2
MSRAATELPAAIPVEACRAVAALACDARCWLSLKGGNTGRHAERHVLETKRCVSIPRFHTRPGSRRRPCPSRARQAPSDPASLRPPARAAARRCTSPSRSPPG